MKKAFKHDTKIYHAFTTTVLLVAIMFVVVVKFGMEPQIPLIFGCIIAGIVSMWAGWSWEDVLDGMIFGITQSIEAILILFSIGILIGVWICGGVVPTMIYYGIKILSPKIFLPATLLICSAVSLAVGSWGAAGTVGIAFMGIGQALGIPPAMVAGAVVSGAYVGDKISPLTDGTNLAAAVTRTDVFTVAKKMIVVALGVYAVILVAYFLLGFGYADADASAITANTKLVLDGLKNSFRITPFALLPLVIMLLCIILKVPAIPSIMAGIVSGMLQAFLLQGTSFRGILANAYSSVFSKTGVAMLDELLTVGGFESMLYTVSIIILAMALGGIMQYTGQMNALIFPFVRRVRSTTGMTALTTVTCVAANVLLPDQYLSISAPGQMYLEEYEKRGIDTVLLANTLGSGGAVTSALVPWNTCGAYMSTMLGVATFTYLPFAFFNILMPFAMIIYSFFLSKKKK